MSWTHQQADAHNARIASGRLAKLKELTPIEDLADNEGDLHDQIEAECKRRRFYYVHSRMDKKTTQQPGVADFIIFTPFGVFNIECKTRTGKLTAEQATTQHVLRALGYRFEVVRSFSEFLRIVN